MNERNNRGQFLTNPISPVTHVFKMPTGWYNLEDFRSALENALNSSVPLPPTPFLVEALDDFTGYQLKVSNTGTKFFPERTEGLNRNLWDLAGYNYDGAVFTNSIQNDSKLYYTRYIDVISHNIHKHQPIIDEVTNFSGSDILVRIYGNDPQSVRFGVKNDQLVDDLYCVPHTTTREIKNIKWIKQVPSDGFGGGIDIQLVDEFGDVAWVPDPTNYPDYVIGMIARKEI